MSDPTPPTPPDEEPERGIDLPCVVYVVAGIPGIVGFIVVLFALVNLFPSIPA